MMIPKSWERYALGKITETITSGSRDWAQYYSDVGSKFIRMTNLPRDGIYLKLNDLKYVDVKSESSDGQRTSLNPGDILISITAELGKIGWVPDNLGEAFINQHTALVRLKSKFTDSKFVAYLLSSKEMNHKINRLNDSGAKAGLNLSTIRAIPLLLPPLPEQRKIATILETWDKAISTTERLIDNSKQQKNALMQQLLTGAHTQRKRLLDDSGKPFEGEWEEVKLGDVCSKVTDGAHHSPQSVEVGYPMFSVKDMRSTGFAENTARHISEDDFKALEKQNCKPEINDILIAKDGSILKYCFVVKKEIQGVILSSIALLRPKLNKISPHFIAQYFSQESVRFFVGKALTSGSGVPRIILKDFKGIHIRIPNLYEQKKIAAVLNNADKEIELLEQQLADLKQEKKALMQQLLTGKRRVTIG
ncbi:restriction endonuclease subunit S [Marinomonas foliarum]|jgi:type I restriction enzyme, S subunit|uniref:Type I restriction enzyme S subunit n=1 Tax=Marinomonas foliarum TaxID=491950 RepID=A0A368ZJ62_9GAMM|nr:restriction endonuclease subunit S [Marinomonas foliarum]RCW93187.1 type I restriction enzyme S subunit [Marinomonas foliarum]